MAAKLLIYHMKSDRQRALENICAPLGIEAVFTEPASYGAPVGLISGNADIKKLAQTASGLKGKAAEIDEEMIVMSGFTKKQFDGLLDALKRVPMRIELKAVETPTNCYWTGEMLQAELKRERKACGNGRKA